MNSYTTYINHIRNTQTETQPPYLYILLHVLHRFANKIFQIINRQLLSNLNFTSSISE